MPLRDDKLLLLLGKRLSTRKFIDLQSEGFPQFHTWFNVKDRFAGAVSNVHMDWAVFVAVEEEAIPILLEDFRHQRILSERAMKSDQFIFANQCQGVSSELLSLARGPGAWFRED